MLGGSFLLDAMMPIPHLSGRKFYLTNFIIHPFNQPLKTQLYFMREETQFSQITKLHSIQPLASAFQFLSSKIKSYLKFHLNLLFSASNLNSARIMKFKGDREEERRLIKRKHNLVNM